MKNREVTKANENAHCRVESWVPERAQKGSVRARNTRNTGGQNLMARGDDVPVVPATAIVAGTYQRSEAVLANKVCHTKYYVHWRGPHVHGIDIE